jgi:hypothetical protein
MALLGQIHCTVNIAFGIKQNVVTVNVTVKLNLCGGNFRLFKRLQAQETIEWE